MPRPSFAGFAYICLVHIVAVMIIYPITAALGDTIHVPTPPYPTIQQGIDAAQPGDDVEIAAGTYTGPLNRDLDFHGKAIRVHGAGPSTVVDAELLGRGFIFQSGEGAASILEDLTITRGRTSPGGGMRFTGGSSPTVRNCVISSCGAEDGGGMEINGSSPAITNCMILNNRIKFGAGAGVMCTNGAAPVITGSTFQGNVCLQGGSGGAILTVDASPTITACSFIANGAEFGGAIAIFGPLSVMTITDCTISRTSSDSGTIGVSDGSSLLLSGTVLCDNSSAGGSGIFCASATVTVRNSTIVRGRYFHPFDAAAISVHGGPPTRLTLDNTIVAFDQRSSISCEPGTVTVTCSNIFGNSGGDWVSCIAAQQGQAGNFSLDPLFCDLGNCNVELMTGSPCLPGNHPQGVPCGLIGAGDLGCNATPTQPANWGSIKARFRD